MYHRLAEESRHSATIAINAVAKQSLEKMATDWDQLAKQVFAFENRSKP
jgi:hypothetical protein